MRRNSKRDVYPDVFGTLLVPKAMENLIADQVSAHGSKRCSKEHFETGMLETFSNIRRFVQWMIIH